MKKLPGLGMLLSGLMLAGAANAHEYRHHDSRWCDDYGHGHHDHDYRHSSHVSYHYYSYPSSYHVYYHDRYPRERYHHHRRATSVKVRDHGTVSGHISVRF